MQVIDLTQRPPRSMRCRLGGYAILPRILDKCRASLAGQLGEYKYHCPLDQHFFRFTGLDAEVLKAEVAKGGGDWEILQWIQAQAPLKRQAWEILQWSDYQDRRGPDGDRETLEYFMEAVAKFSSVREDIRTWADLLDLDDFVSFGGKA
ncbi:MAG: DUF5069 domain-containing protein [Verrucomicrobiales bacterium]|nr:DUF5069 domain-containing protein [Verrucomicrobiales bacterium]